MEAWRKAWLRRYPITNRQVEDGNGVAFEIQEAFKIGYEAAQDDAKLEQPALAERVRRLEERLERQCGPPPSGDDLAFRRVWNALQEKRIALLRMEFTPDGGDLGPSEKAVLDALQERSWQRLEKALLAPLDDRKEEDTK